MAHLCKNKCTLYFKVKPVANYSMGECFCKGCDCAFTDFPPETIFCPCCGNRLRWKGQKNSTEDQERIAARLMQRSIEIKNRTCTICGSNKTAMQKTHHPIQRYAVWRSLEVLLFGKDYKGKHSWLCGNCYETAYMLYKLPTEKMRSTVHQRLAQFRRLAKLVIVYESVNNTSPILIEN